MTPISVQHADLMMLKHLFFAKLMVLDVVCWGLLGVKLNFSLKFPFFLCEKKVQLTLHGGCRGIQNLCAFSDLAILFCSWKLNACEIL